MTKEDCSVVEFLSQLRDLGVGLYAENDRLRINAPRGVLDSSLREELSHRKAEIIRFLADSRPPVISGLAPIARVPGGRPLSVSFSQERLWFLYQLEPESVAYNIYGGIWLEGQLRVDVLSQSLSEIIRRHEALRTAFSETDGKPVQVILSPSTFNLERVDLQGVSEAERKESARRVVIEEGRRPFDLSKGPLFRAVLIQLRVEEYLLALFMHHIITDGWSTSILWHELEVLYEAFSKGQPSPLAELSVQFADFAQWQREWLTGDVLKAQVDYWTKQLGGELPSLHLPTDRSRPAIQTHRGAHRGFVLPAELVEKLYGLSQRWEGTLFMTLLAAFGTLLFRYTGQTDFVIGTPIANRSRTELERLIGFFVNTLALRMELSGNPQFVELLEKVRETTLGAYDHQDMPFEKLVEVLKPVRDMSYSPLFQVMFVLQNMPMSGLKFSGVELAPAESSPKLAPTENSSGSSMFDLTLYMWEGRRGLTGAIEYNTDLFEAETIKRMIGNFRTLLESVVADPSRRLSELAILTESERDQLLFGWNATEAAYPADKTLVQLFEEQVDRAPEAVAVIFRDEQLTYRQLNRRANDLAHHLRSVGVGPESRVGIWLERGLEMMVGLLGTLKAGGAYVPLDPSYPKERLSFMLQDAQVQVLLTGEKFLGDLPDYTGDTICIDRDGEAIAGGRDENPVSLIGPDRAAYVIYTSGSTGTPKGVIGLHRGAVNRMSWMWRAYPFRDGEVCCQKTYLSFVDSVWEIFGPLLQGISNIIIPEDAVKDPVLLVQELAASHVSRIVLVPSLLRVLLDTFSDLEARLPELRMWTTSGEEIPVELAQRFRQAMPGARLINLYGSSEVSADVTCYEITDATIGRSVPIGRPIHNTQIYLLDGKLQPVPVGVHAELYVGGVGLAQGYLNRSDLTAERFIPNPYREGEVFFKTGDLGRHLPDGNIEYLGRKDHQVKIRGFRVELGEIEVALKQHPAVREGIVLAKEYAPGDKRLVAYLVTAQKLDPPHDDLKEFLRDRLPEHMVPSAFCFLDALPLTPSGKVDRLTLLRQKDFSADQKANYVEPKTEIERTIAAIWQDLLKLERVGINDNFFDLGGHSLLLAQVQNRIQRDLRKELSMITLFQYPTIGSLCNYLHSGEDEGSLFQKIHQRAKRQENAMSLQKPQGKMGGGASE